MTKRLLRHCAKTDTVPRRGPGNPAFFLATFAAVLLCFSFAADAHDDGKDSKKPFGPFAAGQKRQVTRQGKKGIARSPHPVVGSVAKVPGEGPPAPPLRRDADIPEDAIRTANRIGPSLSSSPLWLFALTYRHLVTRIDGPKCSHYPTCSHLANQAVARYGPLGIFIGLDRIIQPPLSSSLRPHPQVVFPELTRAFDPLSNYEFWKPSFDPMPAETEESPLLFDVPPPETLDSTPDDLSSSNHEAAHSEVPSTNPTSATAKEEQPSENGSLDDTTQPPAQNISSSKKNEAS
ncbi:MAG: membrane protein insertion efficiency factor YidD [Deltaproteobacteria bacterium]|nr:membrane protein insertion efficiency factor YidD [Deltaproteobacteria bacterium]